MFSFCCTPGKDFNPRSREGSDQSPTVLIAIRGYFNPRSREGSDKAKDVSNPTSEISIRAPARGATKHNGFLLLRLRFQSALPRGERPYAVDLSVGNLRFQSALPRGERQQLMPLPYLNGDFNPRSREGSDRTINYLCNITITISIRAPARGATVPRSPEQYGWQFQSALPRGERRYGAVGRAYSISISIRAPARGATEVSAIGFSLLTDFNPRSREGSDMAKAVLVMDMPISIRAPARGATEIANV